MGTLSPCAVPTPTSNAPTKIDATPVIPNLCILMAAVLCCYADHLLSSDREQLRAFNLSIGALIFCVTQLTPIDKARFLSAPAHGARVARPRRSLPRLVTGTIWNSSNHIEPCRRNPAAGQKDLSDTVFRTK